MIKAKVRWKMKRNIFYFDDFRLGIDAFCVISLGDEKYVTGVSQSTTSPEWMTQCDL